MAGIAVIKGDKVNGTLQFSPVEGGVRVHGEIHGLAAGDHGFHVHQFGDLSNGCVSAGSHFNPHNQTHGAPSDAVRHVGDLGNVVADAGGVAKIDFVDKTIALSGANGIVGRALVIHEGKDDLGKGGNEDSLKTGNAGGRLGCAVIGLKM